MTRRGALLIEGMVAVAVFVAAGLAILAAMRGAAHEARRERDLLRAMDLARSTLSSLESGLATPEQLDGPVPKWSEESAGFEDAPTEPSGWSLTIETSPSSFDGLVMITVRVSRGSDRSDQREELYALGQLVRLGSAAGATR